MAQLSEAKLTKIIIFFLNEVKEGTELRKKEGEEKRKEIRFQVVSLLFNA